MALVLLAIRFAFKNRIRSLITALGVGVTLLAFLLLRTFVASRYTVNEKVARTYRMVIPHKVASDPMTARTCPSVASSASG